MNLIGLGDPSVGTSAESEYNSPLYRQTRNVSIGARRSKGARGNLLAIFDRASEASMLQLGLKIVFPHVRMFGFPPVLA
jgi:hypothetical protein